MSPSLRFQVKASIGGVGGGDVDRVDEEEGVDEDDGVDEVEVRCGVPHCCS